MAARQRRMLLVLIIGHRHWRLVVIWWFNLNFVALPFWTGALRSGLGQRGKAMQDDLTDGVIFL